MLCNGMAQGLTRVLELGHPQLAESALRMLAELASVGSSASPLRLAHPARNALQALINALLAEGEEMQLLATAALSDVAPHAWDRLPEAAVVAVGSLLNILQSGGSEATRDQAAWALWGLASTHDLSSSLVPGIAPITALLNSESDRAQEAGGWLAWLLASQAEHVEAMVEAGAVPGLMRVLARGRLAAQEAAAWAIWAVADADRTAAKEFVEMGATEALRDLAAVGSPSAKEGATGALAALKALRHTLRAVTNFIASHSPTKGRFASPGRSPSRLNAEGGSTPASNESRLRGSPVASHSPGGSALMARLQWGAVHSPGRKGRTGMSGSPGGSPLARSIFTPQSRRTKSRLGDVTSPAAVRLLDAAAGMAGAASSLEMQDSAAVMQDVIASRVQPGEDQPGGKEQAQQPSGEASSSGTRASSQGSTREGMWLPLPPEAHAKPPAPAARRLQEVEAQLDSSSPDKIHPSRRALAGVASDQGADKHLAALFTAIQQTSEPDRMQVAMVAVKQEVQRRPHEALPVLNRLGAIDTLVRVIESPQWLPITHRTAAEVQSQHHGFDMPSCLHAVPALFYQAARLCKM